MPFIPLPPRPRPPLCACRGVGALAGAADCSWATTGFWAWPRPSRWGKLLSWGGWAWMSCFCQVIDLITISINTINHHDEITSCKHFFVVSFSCHCAHTVEKSAFCTPHPCQQEGCAGMHRRSSAMLPPSATTLAWRWLWVDGGCRMPACRVGGLCGFCRRPLRRREGYRRRIERGIRLFVCRIGDPNASIVPCALCLLRVGPGCQDACGVSYWHSPTHEHPYSVRNSSEGACVY